MSKAGAPSIYSIPAHRGFSDALASGLISRFSDDVFGLSRVTLLVPNQRAGRAITEAFVRQAENGLLMPRIVTIGDIDLAESLGPALDTIGSGPDILPAIGGVRRLFELSRIVEECSFHLSGKPNASERLRLARELAGTIDQLLVEEIDVTALSQFDIAKELAEHWEKSLTFFDAVHEKWRARLNALGMIDAADRRNQLLRHAAKKWQSAPAKHPVIAAGITTAAPAVAALQKTVAFMKTGLVVLPDLDLALDPAIWYALEPVEFGPDEPQPAVGVVTHPQYHLKLLLHRMDVDREEVMLWARSGSSDAPAIRSKIISNIFLPAKESQSWRDLDSRERSLSNVSILEAANPAEESLAIAIRVREALEQREQRIAIVTPDRALAIRIAAQLKRWNIEADDSAGQKLSNTPEGALFLTLADCADRNLAPVPLLALLKHPLVMSGEGRSEWLRYVRKLDLVLRGPAPGPGFAGLYDAIRANKRALSDDEERDSLAAWLRSLETLLAPICRYFEQHTHTLGEYLSALRETLTALCGPRIWSGRAGRSLADLVSELEFEMGDGREITIKPRQGPPIIRSFMDEVAVRPAYGNHPNVAIYGLLEARLQQADIVICAGLNEGTWPQVPDIDPLLSPRIGREIGLMPPEFRIGLAAHDLAGAMGAKTVLLTRAKRESSGPAIASRFFLRLKAMSGGNVKSDDTALALARALDTRLPKSATPKPEPMPSAKQRRVDIAVTDLDRLRADPYAFYARKILGLSALDEVDAEPSPAWRGTAVHDILEEWAKHDDLNPSKLVARAQDLLESDSTSALMRTLWRPRLMEAITWIAEETQSLIAEGRSVLAAEIWGDIKIKGVKVKGMADRIDRTSDGKGLAIIDYKTGSPPSGSQVEAGFALQLGLLGLIARENGFKNISGEPERFEYWSLGKNKEDGFGYRSEPVKEGRKRSGLLRDEFVDKTEEYLIEAIDNWIIGTEPFTAKLNPDQPSYNDYDQLMRLDEWYGRITRGDEVGKKS